MFFLSKLIFIRKQRFPLILSIIITAMVPLLAYSPIALGIEQRVVNSTSISLKKANLNNDQILNWADKAIHAIFNYDYSNYKEALQTASTYFTPAAWKQFQDALTKSSNIKNVVENKIKTTVTLTAPARILEQGVAFGRYGWKVQIPADLTYIDTKTNSIIKTEHMIATINIIRVPNNINPQGIAIHAINYYYIF
jgi:intracellular multiplication protein IcmL